MYPRRGGAAVKEGCRILATTFLSLLVPLSFLLLSRLSAARFFYSITKLDEANHPHKISFLTSLFYYSNTTLILTVVVSVVAISALVHCLTGGNKAAFFITSKRGRLHASWALFFLIEFGLILGIHGTIDEEIKNSYAYTEGTLFSPSRLFFALGLHETMVFWWRNAVKPVADETAVFGVSGEAFGWVESVVSAVAFGNLWWRKLRDEAEALVVLPWVMRVELRMDVAAADVLGWLLYYLTAAIGAVRMIRALFWVVMWVFRYGPAARKESLPTVMKNNSAQNRR